VCTTRDGRIIGEYISRSCLEQDNTRLLFLPESWYLDGVDGHGWIWTYIGKASRSRVHWDLEFKTCFSSFSGPPSVLAG